MRRSKKRLKTAKAAAEIDFQAVSLCNMLVVYKKFKFLQVLGNKKTGERSNSPAVILQAAFYHIRVIYCKV